MSTRKIALESLKFLADQDEAHAKSLEAQLKTPSRENLQMSAPAFLRQRASRYRDAYLELFSAPLPEEEQPRPRKTPFWIKLIGVVAGGLAVGMIVAMLSSVLP